MEVKVKRIQNVEYRDELCPDGWVEVDVFHPCGSNPPYDYHGGKHQREYRKVLLNAGIESMALVTHRKIIHPMGSGTNGSVRMGDDMIPGVYRIAVKCDYEAKAQAAFANTGATPRRCGADCPAVGGSSLPAPSPQTRSNLRSIRRSQSL